MAQNIQEILPQEDVQDLYEEVMDTISNGGDYDDVEDIMLGYGLEMDYIESLLF